MKKMRFSNKGQAALEFIMTYGWAILVVLVAIGALAYFGVLSPDRLLPNKCILASGISCDDAKVTANGITVKLTNSLGQDLQNAELHSYGTCIHGVVAGNGDLTNFTGATSLSNGQSSSYTITCATALSGTKYSGDITFNYTSIDSGIRHSMKGNLIQKIES